MAKVTSTTKIKRRKITFFLNSSDAKEVILIGDFNKWNPKKHPMKGDGNGMWKKSVMLVPGSYEYKFLVDGEYKEDPQSIHKSANCFGTYNSVFNLTADLV